MTTYKIKFVYGTESFDYAAKFDNFEDARDRAFDIARNIPLDAKVEVHQKHHRDPVPGRTWPPVVAFTRELIVRQINATLPRQDGAAVGDVRANSADGETYPYIIGFAEVNNPLTQDRHTYWFIEGEDDFRFASRQDARDAAKAFKRQDAALVPPLPKRERARISRLIEDAGETYPGPIGAAHCIHYCRGYRVGRYTPDPKVNYGRETLGEACALLRVSTLKPTGICNYWFIGG